MRNVQHEDAATPPRRSKRLKLAKQHSRTTASSGPLPAEISSNTSVNKAPASDGLCEDCRLINFDEIFNTEVRDYDLARGYRLVDLTRLRNKPLPVCRLCRFLYSMRQRDIGEEPVEFYSLFAFSASFTFKLPRNAIQDCRLLAVLPTNTPRLEARDQFGPLVYIMETVSNPDLISGRRIEEKLDVNLVRDWLNFCDEHHHKFCEQQTLPSIPGFRVIDCVSRQITQWEHLPTAKPYVTLSYVWGSSNTGSSTFSSTLPTDVPELIEDAVRLTTLLGFEYLWIDRYCIPQDDARSKSIQIQNMGLIYARSALTIIAAAGDDPAIGLHGVHKLSRSKQAFIQLGNRTLVSTKEPFVPIILRSKWNSRGWTFQEALLSCRRLVFSKCQVYFQCRSMHCLETISLPLKPLHISKMQRFPDGIDVGRVFPLRTVGINTDLESFETRLIEYQKRSLSFDADFLNAFQGILQAFKQRKRPIHNLLGVPLYPCKNSNTAKLAFGLTWSISIRRTVRLEAFPSWSWIGWKSRKQTHPNLFLLSNPGDTRELKLDDDNFSSRIQASVGFSHGEIIPWEDNWEEITRRSESGSQIQFLSLSGWLEEFYVTESGELVENDQDSNLVTTLNRKVVEEASHYILALLQMPEGLIQQQNGLYQLSCLILGQVYVDALYCLLLYKNCRTDCIERFHSLTCYSPQIGKLLASEGKCPKPFYLTEVRLT